MQQAIKERPAIFWKAEYSIGVDAIDRQHRKIFEHLLALENSIEKKDPWHVLRFLIGDLAECLQLHLAVEEALLEIVKYPGLEDHRAAHEQLTAAIADLEDAIRRSPSVSHLVAFFEQWFIRHVLASDREFARYVAEALGGPAPAASPLPG